jgi:hypothetical protein
MHSTGPNPANIKYNNYNTTTDDWRRRRRIYYCDYDNNYDYSRSSGNPCR